MKSLVQKKHYLGVAMIMLILSILFESCKSQNSEQGDMVKLWIGKEIIIPKDLNFQIQGIPIDYDFDNADFKIVTYIDSAGCSGCRMKLNEWHQLINKYKSNPEIDVNFVMIISPSNVSEVNNIIKEHKFKHPICIDTLAQFSRANNPPRHSSFQTFLLDRDNTVIAIGNPVYNPKIKELYSQWIFGNSDYESENEERLSICTDTIRSLGLVNKHDTVHEIFRLENYNFKKLTLQEIVPSCHCIRGEMSSESISKGAHAYINIEYKADSISRPIYQYIDVYFKELENPVRFILYGYVK